MITLLLVFVDEVKAVFGDSTFAEVVINGALLHDDGVVSEVSSSGLLLSSVSFPLLPKLQSGLSFPDGADDGFFPFKSETDEGTDGAVVTSLLFTLLLFSIAVLSDIGFDDDVSSSGGVTVILVIFVLIGFSPFLDNDEEDDDDKEDDVDEGPIAQLTNDCADNKFADGVTIVSVFETWFVVILFVLTVDVGTNTEEDNGVFAFSPFFCCAIC